MGSKLVKLRLNLFSSSLTSSIVAGSIFVPLAEDKFFDISGTLGFFTTTFVSLYYRSLKAKFIDGLPIELPGLSGFASRQLFLSAALGLWGVRLGSFLFLVCLTRILSEMDIVS